MHPETQATKDGGAFRGNQHTGNVVNENSSLTFTEDSARATGRTRRSVEIAAARGEKLGEDLSDIAGTSLDKGVELDALADKDERRDLVERVMKEFVATGPACM